MTLSDIPPQPSPLEILCEDGPLIAVNKPGDNRRGTVGGLLPGIEARLEPVEGIPGGGKLLVRGANVMAGYLT